MSTYHDTGVSEEELNAICVGRRYSEAPQLMTNGCIEMEKQKEVLNLGQNLRHAALSERIIDRIIEVGLHRQFIVKKSEYESDQDFHGSGECFTIKREHVVRRLLKTKKSMNTCCKLDADDHLDINLLTIRTISLLGRCIQAAAYNMKLYVGVDAHGDTTDYDANTVKSATVIRHTKRKKSAKWKR
jgi:hypothetical protein